MFLGDFARGFQNRGAGKHDRDLFARAHDIFDMGEKLAAECAARMRASEVFLCKALGVHTSNGQCIAHCQRGRGRRRGREVERAGFKGHVHIEVDIGVTRKRTFRISRNRNELGAFAFDNRDDREQLVGSARVRNADDDIVDCDHTQVAVGGFGGMHEKGGRTGGGERCGKLAADVSRLAYAADDNAAFAVQEHFNGFSKMWRVERIGKISDGLRFVQEHFATERDGAVAVGSIVHKNE